MSGKMGMFMQVLPVMISILLLSSLFEAFYFLPLHAKEFFSIGNIKTMQNHEGGWKHFVAALYCGVDNRYDEGHEVSTLP